MQGHRFHGLELGVRSVTGARAMRIVHPAGQQIGAHRHDWPLLTIPVLGGYREECDEGSVLIDGPAVVFHPAGRCHANCIHNRGMETFSIEFDPDWLMYRGAGLRLDRSQYWIGGEPALVGRKLASVWADEGTSDAQLRQATGRFLAIAFGQQARTVPHWFGEAQRLLALSAPPSTAEIARRLRLHPAWLAHSYRAIAGEGLQESVMRRRTEQAVHLLRTTDQAMAEIAIDSGFCDQSHMNRVLRQLTGRTPAQIRSEREALRLVAETRAA